LNNLDEVTFGQEFGLEGKPHSKYIRKNVFKLSKFIIKLFWLPYSMMNYLFSYSIYSAYNLTNFLHIGFWIKRL